MIHAINVNINRVFLLGQTYVNDQLRPYGLSSGVFQFILALADQGELTMQSLNCEVLFNSPNR